MARQRFSISNFDQFKRSYESVTGDIGRQNALRQAFPDYYKQLMNEYKTNILTKKKIGLDKAKAEVAKGNIKPTVVKDVAKVTSTANKAANIGSKALSIGGKAIKGLGNAAARIAPIQGAVNLFSKDSDIMDRLAGAGMIGTGIATMAGSAAAAPWAAALVGGDLLKKTVARPVGEKIGQAIYGKEPDVSNIYSGLADVDMPDPMMKQLTPEQEQKVRAYNKRVINNSLAQADASLARGQEEIDAYNNLINGNQDTVNQIENDVRGGSYPVSQSGYGVYPQNSQDARESGLNIIQDVLHSEPYKPSLKPIVEPVNYSNEYLASQNNLINKLQQNANQGEQQMSMNGMAPVPENPYDLGGLRPYAQIDNQQLAPVPSQQQGLDYGAIMSQFNDAMKADQRQNQINQMINAFGVFGTPARRAPIYFIDHKGKMQAIELDQPSEVAPLPTNTTSNYDKLMGQLKIQQAQQADILARQKQAAADLKAQQEYIANQNMMNALGQHLNVDPNMFANPDIAKAALQYVFNPDIQSRANVQETIGKAPTQAMLKAAEQRGETAGKLDEIQLQSQYNAMLANINNNAKMEEQAMIQSGMDRRTAAQLATQRLIAQTSQLEQNYRAMLEDSRARDLAEYNRGTQWGVADRYTAARGAGSEKPTLSLGEQVYLESVKSGTPIPQALKYAQVVDPNFGLSDAERAELNR